MVESQIEQHEPDVKWEYRKVPVESLSVSHDYQRPEVQNTIRRIINGFDPDAFGTLTVARREDGSLWVVDGQQRLRAAIQLGMKDVPCVVFSSDKKSHEARVFREINRVRSSVNSRQVFKAALLEGDSIARRIKRIVESVGFQLKLQGEEQGWPTLACVQAIANIYKKGGDDLLTKTLAVIGEAWDGIDDAVRSDIVQGIALFLELYGQLINERRLQRLLKRVEPMDLLHWSDLERKLTGGSRARAVADGLRRYYNRGITKERLPESEVLQ